MAPSDSSTANTRASFTSNTIPVRVYCLKPVRLTSSRYGPTGRFGSVYDPFASVTVVRFRPVSVCVAVTSAPGSTPPPVSFTTPVICAVDPACARSTALVSRIAREPPTSPRSARFIEPPRDPGKRFDLTSVIRPSGPLRGRNGEPLLAVRIVHRAALGVEDHRRALLGRERIPLWQQLVVRVACGGERDPGGAHTLGQRMAILTITNHRLADVDVLKHERNVHAVHRAQASAGDRRVPLEPVHVDRRLAERRLALRLRVGSAAELRRVGLDDEREVEIAGRWPAFSIHGDDLIHLSVVNGAECPLDALAQRGVIGRRRIVGVDV